MSLVRSGCLLLSLILLTACQQNEVKSTPFVAQTQLRAVLTQQDGQWFATDCTSGSKERFQLIDDVNFAMDANHLITKTKGSLFIDAIGIVNNKPTLNSAGSFTVKQLNRLTIDPNKGCKEDDYNRVIVRTIGKNPLWVTSIAPRGLVLERLDQAPLVLPYVDERLPAGQMNFATEANGQTIQLWVAPERCIDEETEDVYGMRAILTINYQTLQGCGYLGKSSNVINY